MKVKRGELKREVRLAAQRCAEKEAKRTARNIWLAYWKKFDRRKQKS